MERYAGQGEGWAVGPSPQHFCVFPTRSSLSPTVQGFKEVLSCVRTDCLIDSVLILFLEGGVTESSKVQLRLDLPEVYPPARVV